MTIYRNDRVGGRVRRQGRAKATVHPRPLMLLCVLSALSVSLNALLLVRVGIIIVEKAFTHNLTPLETVGLRQDFAKHCSTDAFPLFL